MKAPVDYTLDECVKNVGARRFIVRNLTPNLNQETKRETKEKSRENCTTFSLST